MLSTGFCCFPCRQRGLSEYESSNLIAIDFNCWLDVHVSNLHEPVGAGEERELITIFYSPQKIVIIIPPLPPWRENAKKSFDWNLGTPQTKHWSPKTCQSLSNPFSLYSTALRLLSTYTRSRNQIVQYTLRYYCNSALLRTSVHLLHYNGFVHEYARK